MALTPQQKTADNRLTLRIIGAVLVVLGLWAATQPGDSILFVGLIVGIFLLIAPEMFSNWRVTNVKSNSSTGEKPTLTTSSRSAPEVETVQEYKGYIGEFTHVYVGLLEDPKFHWEGGDSSGNIPRRYLPQRPLGRWMGFQIYERVIQWIEAGTYVGKQTDWGAWVAKVSKAQVRRGF